MFRIAPQNPKIKKYKEIFENLKNSNEYKEVKIDFNNEVAFIQIPNLACKNFESFKWQWFTNDTDISKKKVKLFEQVVEILLELNNCFKIGTTQEDKGKIIYIPNSKFKKLFLELDVKGLISVAKYVIDHIGINFYNKIATTFLKDSETIYPATCDGYPTKKLFEEYKVYNEAMQITPLPKPVINIAEDEKIKVLGDKIELINYDKAEFEIKSILKCLSIKSFIDTILENVTPKVHELLKQKILLYFAHKWKKSLINESTICKILNSYNDKTLITDWQDQDYKYLTIDEIVNKHTTLTGGLYHLE